MSIVRKLDDLQKYQNRRKLNQRRHTKKRKSTNESPYGLTFSKQIR